jgi:hypothetical protein
MHYMQDELCKFIFSEKEQRRDISGVYLLPAIVVADPKGGITSSSTNHF